MDFLQLTGKHILVMGVANRRSVAWSVAETLRENGALPIFAFRNQELLDKNRKLIGEDAPALICDVEKDEDIAGLPAAVAKFTPALDGYVHSIAFANYSEGLKPFHGTLKRDFLQAVDISCFSLIQTADALKSMFTPEASIVTMSISATRMASESYGYMGPVKAALDSSVAFLAKSLSQHISPRLRVNAVGSGPLKTSSSAGIPGYVDAYLYTEKAIPRHQALATREAADVVCFLLSPRSSGINAQTVITDAGMSINYFDRDIIRGAVGTGDKQ